MNTAAKTKYPDNLASLHLGEKQLRAQSVAAIEAAENLTAHVSVIHLRHGSDRLLLQTVQAPQTG